MEMRYTVFHPDGRKESHTVDWPPEPGYKRINALISPLVGGHIEHVAVLHNDQRADMFVNETGAVQSPPLPINDAATAIYHAASLARGDDISDAPPIHGVAVLFDKVVWI